MIQFWVDPSNNIEKNKRPPTMIYLSTLGAYWNKCGSKYSYFDLNSDFFGVSLAFKFE